MAIKHLYAVGDSFTYGDELLDSVADKYPELRAYAGKKFTIERINEVYRKSKHVHQRMMEIKDSMTYPGQLAKMLGCECTNYAQPGSSLDSILFQIHFAINDIKERGLKTEECFILVGITSPYRKALIDIEYMNEYLPKDFIIRSTSGSVMIAQPDNSIMHSKPLAEAMGKYISMEQFVTEFVFQLVNIDNMLERFGSPYMLVNVWNHSFLRDIENNVVRKLCTDALDLFKTINKIVPGYPESLVTKIPEAVYQANLVTHLGHPNSTIHQMWAEALIPKVKEIIYALDQKNN